MDNIYSTSSVPEEWTGVPEKPVRIIELSDVSSFKYNEPVVINLPKSELAFIRIDLENVVHELLFRFGESTVPVACLDGDVRQLSLSNWYENKQGKYLKDWHINQKERVFITPPFFTDWLNEFHDFSRDSVAKLDFQFLYWGDAGSCTGYHEDVFGTFSWSFNLNGRKLWRFFVERAESRHIYTLTQERHQMVFVPSGCYHTVENLVNDTISINQNWFNEWNIVNVCERLIGDFQKIKQEFSDFGVTFESLSEEAERIELILRSNNCLNIGILLDICGHVLINKGDTRATVRQCIAQAIRLIKSEVFPLTSSCTLQIDHLARFPD